MLSVSSIWFNKDTGLRKAVTFWYTICIVAVDIKISALCHHKPG
jgi:hypothetical protein